MNELIEKNMEKGMKNYKQPGYEGVTKTWDIIQREVNTEHGEYTGLPIKYKNPWTVQGFEGCNWNFIP